MTLRPVSVSASVGVCWSLVHMSSPFNKNKKKNTNVLKCFVARQKRLHNDKAINKTAIDVLQDKDWETISWKQLQVGDIVRVSLLNFLNFPFKYY